MKRSVYISDIMNVASIIYIFTNLPFLSIYFLTDIII